MAYSDDELEANKKALRDVNFFDLFNPNQPRSDNDVQSERLAICETCEFFRHTSQTCKKCGCFMKLKVTLDNARCPMHKW
jgi:uncharacterized paraquat-inducible protein A